MMQMNKQLESEILGVKKQVERLSNSEMSKLLQAYKRSLEEVRTDIAKLYTKYAVDGTLSVSQQQRYTIIKEMERKFLAEASKLGHIDIGHTTKILTDVYKESLLRTTYVIDKGTSVAIDFSILRPEFVEKVVFADFKGGINFSDRIWTNKSKMVEKLQRELERGIMNGDSIDKMSKRFANTMGSSANDSRRLIHTEMARVQSEAADTVYKNSEVVTKILFTATLDNVTSEICEENDGKYFDIDEDYPKPPLHPFCRSVIVPVIEGWSPSLRRENIEDETGNKKVTDYTSYKSWKQSKDID